MAKDTLKTDITNNVFHRLYLIYGEESYLKEHYRSQIVKAFENDGFADFNLKICDGKSLSYEDFTEFCDGFPMMASRKLLLIHDFNINKPPAEYKDKLPEFLTNVPEYLTVVFYMADEEFKPDKRLTLWKSMDKVASVSEVNRASRSDLTAWIKRRFKALEKDISTDNADFLIFLCGSLMTNLVTEIEKIASGTQSITIERRHIEQLASPTLEAQIFDLSEKIAQQDYQGAFSILNTLVALKHEPIAICAVLTKQIGRMYGAKLALNANCSEGEIMKLLGFKSQYPATLLCRSARASSLKWLKRAVTLCYETDLQLKSNIPGSERKLEILLCKLADKR